MIETDKSKKKRPSRAKYEKEHPTISFRVDKETYQRLTEHIQSTGASFSDFVRESLEKEKSLVEKRVEALALQAYQKVGAIIEDRIKASEILVSEIITTIASIPGDKVGHDFRCPRCPNASLSSYIGKETATGKYIIVWACPTCNFVTRSRKPLDPETLFPFPAENLRSFLKGTYDAEELIKSLKQAKIKFPRPKLMQKAGKPAG